MTISTPHPDPIRADFYRSLAQSFRIPSSEGFAIAFCRDLALDLAELEGELGYGVAEEIAEFARRVSVIQDPCELLRLYSRLFLQPPRLVHLNTAVYLDGMLNGANALEIESWYLACGLTKSKDFKDLADHLSVQLEFIAYLYTQAGCELPYRAGQFIGRFVCRWIGPLIQDLSEAERQLGWLDEPYLPLLRILAQAAVRDAESPIADPLQARQERALALARYRQASRGITEQDLAAIRNKLAAQGLANAHVDTPWTLRDEQLGWRSATPPRPR